MQSNYPDPKDKSTENSDQPLQRQENEEGLHLVNEDGTDFDTSERTYISVDLPEEETEDNKSESGKE